MDEQKPMGGDDLYSDGPGEEAAAEKPTDEEKGEPAHDESAEAVLPKSILGGKQFNVGDEVVLKITAMHDDQISVAYAPAKPEGGKESGGEEVKMPAGMGGGDSDYD